MRTEEKYRSSSPPTLQMILSQPKKQIQMRSSLRKRFSESNKIKLPSIILSYIKNSKQSNQQQKKSQDEYQNNLARMASRLRVSSGLRKIYQKKICQICENQVAVDQFVSIGKCNHQYCSSCLHQYIIYKIKSFQKVQCPSTDCPELLQIQSKAYSQIPLDVRKIFKKIKQYQQSNQQGKKLCPNQDCQGVLNLNDPVANPTCPECKRVYCNQCFFAAHQGQCDPYQLNFFKNTLHYRQCKGCKNVIQKNQGCNHMTCKCGYQFCYICGNKWRSNHQCTNPNNEPIAPNVCNLCCCSCYCCCRIGTICNFQFECCCQECRTPMLFLSKLGYIILWLCFILPFYLFIATMHTLAILAISILGGVVVFPFIVMKDNGGVICILAIVFLPVTMVIGIIVAISEIFCKVFRNDIKQEILTPFQWLCDKLSDT